MSSATPPQRTQVLVIGGGPGGSYTASALAREGFNVVLLEMSKLPRYHIGESLLPSARHYLRFIGAEEKVAACGFARKPGSAIKFNQYLQEGYTDFVALGANNSSWNVIRSEFDYVLYKHAQDCGAHVFDETKVTAIHFDSEVSTSPRSRTPSDGFNAGLRDVDAALGRPTSATYVTASGEKGEIQFDFLVDASGRAGVMSTKYLKNRRYNESLKNVAVWGYWRNTGMYGKGTTRENAPWFEALSDESGWAWFIPLHNGLTSVGVVMDQKQLRVRSRACSTASGYSRSPGPSPSSPSFPSFGYSRAGSTPPPSPMSSRSFSFVPPTPAGEEISSRRTSALADRYLSFLHLAPGVLNLIGDGELVKVDDGEFPISEDDDTGSEVPLTRSASDYSYSAGRYAGNGWRIVGDAGAFIDPFFSSGVHLAFTGALASAASISASIRGDCAESEAAEWYSSRVAISYTRFLVVVLSAYKQIRAQSVNVLADIEDKNFDKAFEFLRPVIQGGAEMGTKLSEDEVQKALDFCINLFSPTTPEQHENVRNKLKLRLNISATQREDTLHGVYPGSNTIGEQGPEIDGEKLLDVHAPLINPSSLTRFLRTRFRGFSLSAPPSPLSPTSPTVPPLFPSGTSESAASSDSEMEPESPIDRFGLGPPLSLAIPVAGRGEEDSEMRMVLEKVNARRVIHAEHGSGLNSMEQETIAGFTVRLDRGCLGLTRSTVNQE